MANVFHRFKLPDDFIRRFGCRQADRNDEQAGNDKRRQKLINREDTAQFTDQLFPDDYGDAARQHTCDSTGEVDAFPEQGKENQRTECGTKSGPCIGNDAKNRVVSGQRDEDAKPRDKQQLDSGDPHDGAVRYFLCQETAENIAGNGRRGNQHVGVG